MVRRCYNSEIGFVSFWGLALVIPPATARRFRSAVGAVADITARCVLFPFGSCLSYSFCYREEVSVRCRGGCGYNSEMCSVFPLGLALVIHSAIA